MTKAWFRGVIAREETDGEPVTVYVRGVQDYAADMANAQRRVDMAIAALEQAKDELARSQIAFIAHCREIELPIEMEPAMYPPRQYRLED